MRKTATDTGIKHDQGKLPMSLIPVEAKRGLAAVLAFGATKYTRENWRGGMAWSRLMDSAYRHLDAICAGEDLDPESGLPHVDHLQACAAFLSTYMKLGLGTDDRYKPAKKGRA